MNPDCRDGKHDACNGDGWDGERSIPCVCPCHHDDDRPDEEQGPQALFDAYCNQQGIHTYRELIALLEEQDREGAKVEAERDALRAQLDGMTSSVEYAYGALDAPDTITPTGEDIDDLGSARYNAEEYWLSVLQRTVKRGPWVEVSS